jgi:hypothetical protein
MRQARPDGGVGAGHMLARLGDRKQGGGQRQVRYSGDGLTAPSRGMPPRAQAEEGRTR